MDKKIAALCLPFAGPLIRKFLADMGEEMSASQLGVAAVKDPSFVPRVLAGRQPRISSMIKLLRVIERHRPDLAKRFVAQQFEGMSHE